MGRTTIGGRRGEAEHGEGKRGKKLNYKLFIRGKVKGGYVLGDVKMGCFCELCEREWLEYSLDCCCICVNCILNMMKGVW